MHELMQRKFISSICNFFSRMIHCYDSKKVIYLTNSHSNEDLIDTTKCKLIENGDRMLCSDISIANLLVVGDNRLKRQIIPIAMV